MLSSTEEEIACSLAGLLHDELHQLNSDDEGWVKFDDLYYKYDHRPAPGWLFHIAAHSKQNQEARFDVLRKPYGWFIRRIRSMIRRSC